jgi:hypothetical protein
MPKVSRTVRGRSRLPALGIVPGGGDGSGELTGEGVYPSETAGVAAGSAGAGDVAEPMGASVCPLVMIVQLISARVVTMKKSAFRFFM